MQRSSPHQQSTDIDKKFCAEDGEALGDLDTLAEIGFMTAPLVI